MRVRAPLALALAALMLSGCAGESEQQELSGLTSDQAERLAVTRFRNFDAGTRAIDLLVPQSELGELQLTGWFDFEQGVGYGAILNGGTVWWNADTVAIRDTPSAEPVLPLPADGWVTYPLEASANPLATALLLVGSLGTDRPENPQLLAQSDALWLRQDTIDGIDVDVFIGPSADGATASSDSAERARYWVDEAGILIKFETLISGEWMTLTFADGGAISLPATVPGMP